MKKKSDILFQILSPMLAIVVALLIAFAIIFMVSDEPIEALQAFMIGPFTTTRRLGNVIEAMIPLIFTGLAACVMFQAKQFSLIADGSFLVGALAAAVFVLNVAMPAGIHGTVAILLGGVVGGICAIIPGFLKAKWNANEFVVSMMFNSILVYFTVYVLLNFIRDKDSGFLASFKLPDTARLPKIIDGTKIHLGLIIALVMVVLTWLFLYKTRWGYSIRMVGCNPNFSSYAGINTFLVVFACQIIGGFIAGIGGSVELLGMYERFQWQDTPGYGFDGMTVAILAANNPALVPLGALFIAYIRVGAEIMARTSNVPNEMVNIIQGIIMLMVTSSAFLSRWKHRAVIQSVRGSVKEKAKEEAC